MSERPSRQLRLATEDSHRRLEQVSVFSVLLTNSVTIDDYFVALQVLYSFYRKIDASVMRLTGELPYQQRLPLLSKDLRALGLSSPEIETPEARNMTLAAAWGCRYVIEGSALGGVILAKHLASCFDKELDGAMHFYRFRQPNLSWPQVQSKIDSVLSDPNMLAEARESACQCFEHLYELAMKRQR